MMPPVLYSERLCLRGLKERDFDTYRRFFSDGGASHFYGGPLRPDLAWKRLALDIGHWQLRGFGPWAVDLRETGAMIGGCGLVWAGGWPRPELTWWLLAEARRQGFATEASLKVIDYALDVLSWPFVQTHLNDNNEGARRLALRLGGKIIARERFPDGVERNVYRLERAPRR